MQNLQVLVLTFSEGFAGPKISNAGLKHLTGLRKLKSLNLNGARITDAGLEQLARLSVLESLKLVNTNVSRQGVSKLKRRLGNCQVEL